MEKDEAVDDMNDNDEKTWWYRLIDDNWTRKPTAFCTRYDGYLTDGLIRTHKCKKRRCIRLKSVEYGISIEEGEAKQNENE